MKASAMSDSQNNIMQRFFSDDFEVATSYDMDLYCKSCDIGHNLIHSYHTAGIRLDVTFLTFFVAAAALACADAEMTEEEWLHSCKVQYRRYRQYMQEKEMGKVMGHA